MRLKFVALASVATLTVGARAGAADFPAATPTQTTAVPFFLFSDTQLQYWDEFTPTDPGVGRTNKQVLTIQHADAWAYGTNFVHLSWLYSDKRDPAECDGFANPTQPSCVNTQGMMEFYGLYRGTWGLNEVTHSKSFAIPGFIKDVALSFGADWETENQNFAAEKKDVVGGLQFQFDLPQGFANISIHAYQEWNHNALPGTINSNVTFNTVPEVEFAYTVPVPGTKELLYIGGFTNYVLPKGPDGFGNQTKAEFLSDNRLTLDIGKLFLDKPHVYDAFIGYRYWLNKYGNNDDVATNGNLQGMKEETWYAGVAWHALSDAPSVTSSAMPVKAQPNTPQRFFLFSDTQLQYWDEFTATDPGVGRTNKQVLTIQHADAWAYGTNFVHLSWLYSDSRDPAQCDAFANPTQPSCVNTEGMMEFYGLYRGTWGLNEVTHSKAFAIPGFIKDVALSFGADWETENQNFAAEKKDVVGGLQFQFDLPQGFANISVHAYQEWNHNGLPGTITSDVTFNTVPEFEFAYTVPVPGTKELLYVGGFTNYVFPKGPDGFGNQTKAEFLSDNRLTLDVGQLLLEKPHTYDAFVGYRYWLNKYGNNDDVATNGNLQGMKEETWYAGVAWHVF